MPLAAEVRGLSTIWKSGTGPSAVSDTSIELRRSSRSELPPHVATLDAELPADATDSTIVLAWLA